MDLRRSKNACGRVGWGLVADIHPTTYELRLGILQSKAEKMAVEICKVLELGPALLPPAAGRR